MSLQSAAIVPEQGPPATAVSEMVSVDPVAAAATVYAAVLANPTDVTPTTSKRSLDERNVDVNAPCAVQPDGYGPKTIPDTVLAFKANTNYSVSLSLLNGPLPFTHGRTANCLGRRNSSGLQSRVLKSRWLV